MPTHLPALAWRFFRTKDEESSSGECGPTASLYAQAAKWPSDSETRNDQKRNWLPSVGSSLRHNRSNFALVQIRL